MQSSWRQRQQQQRGRGAREIVQPSSPRASFPHLAGATEEAGVRARVSAGSQAAPADGPDALLRGPAVVAAVDRGPTPGLLLCVLASLLRLPCAVGKSPISCSTSFDVKSPLSMICFLDSSCAPDSAFRSPFWPFLRGDIRSSSFGSAFPFTLVIVFVLLLSSL